MAIGNPILGFTLNRSAERFAPEPGRAPRREDRASLRLQPATPVEEIADAAEPGERLPETNFDYAAAPVDRDAELAMLVARIKASRKRHIEAVHDIGAALLRAKELLGHGNFLPWLQAEFRWSERTANNYMSIARFFKGKTANFADLDIGAAAALAAKSTPAEVRDELLERAEAGESITREEIKERIAASRKARNPAAAEQAQPGEAPSVEAGDPSYAPAMAPVAPAIPSPLVWEPRDSAPAYSDLSFGSSATAAATATDEAGARDLIEAMLGMERLCSGTPADLANQLLISANPQELSSVQRVIDFMVQVKLALDGAGCFYKEPELLPAP
jgi:DUF3102 family protein